MSKKISTDRFLARMCRESYQVFFREFWPLIAAEKLHWTWYMANLCQELQEISERVFADEPKAYDLIWNCPPGTSKSSIVSVLWQPWVWTRMPSARFISGCYAERLALDHSRKSRDVVLSEKYQRLFPEIALREDQNTKGYFANTQGGIRYAVGVGGSVIGMHAHFIIVDDPIDPQGVLSDLILQDANSWMRETLSRRKVNLLLTPTVLIMQRLHQGDPTGDMLERGTAIKHVKLPCDTGWEVKPAEWKSNYEDGLLDPRRLPEPALEDALKELTPDGYAGQYGQEPTPRGGAAFKVERLNYADAPPTSWRRGPIRFWDKASTKGGGAYTAGLWMGLDASENIWILDSIRGQWDSGFRERKILETAYHDTKKTQVGVEQEPGSGGKESAEATVRRLTLAGFRAYAERPSGDKELRADPFSQYVNLGKVIILRGEWNTEYLKEMRYFPKSKYKDQIDASSGAFTGLSKKRRIIGAL